eukprot:CAMPEP_0204086272 /NCGR_PEP_ID=MMETSP0360-20130528/182805_1 /ASSEMBLY_ACC=CAM_ASM_000342 /TAXON_ID=268821 /ORGANISM="Scrippsiella Hangoei, Strain SHTV-5" /LENGTH=87 /DNA_ID=CAMNT_0051035361 /DNA_START=67 /DNA_END=330 /DNA_ORIENTATION=+
MPCIYAKRNQALTTLLPKLPTRLALQWKISPSSAAGSSQPTSACNDCRHARDDLISNDRPPPEQCLQPQERCPHQGNGEVLACQTVL